MSAKRVVATAVVVAAAVATTSVRGLASTGPATISITDRQLLDKQLGSGMGAREIVRTAVGEFRKSTRFPCYGAALPGVLPGVHSGDYAAFSNFGYTAMVVTDTGTNRFDKAGTLWDTVDRLDFDKFARATGGIGKVVREIAKGGSSGSP